MEKQIKIEFLTKKYIPNICNLAKLCWEDEIIENIYNELTASLIDTPKGISKIEFLISFYENEFAGFSGYAKSLVAWDVYELCWSAVIPKFRHKGISTLMLDKRLALIKEKSKGDPYNILVRTFNNQLYQSRGFISTFDNVKCNEGKHLFLAHFD